MTWALIILNVYATYLYRCRHVTRHVPHQEVQA